MAGFVVHTPGSHTLPELAPSMPVFPDLRHALLGHLDSLLGHEEQEEPLVSDQGSADGAQPQNS